MEKNKNKNRIVSLDILRSLAILGVILCHATEGIYSLEPEAVAGLGNISKTFAISAFTFGRFGVPLFLMISGYLLLHPVYEKEDIKKFYKDKFFRLFLTVELWILIYNVFLIWVKDISLTWTDLLKQMVFLQNTGISHMWYMPMLLGMYLCIPFVANGMEKVDYTALYFPMIVFSVYVFAVPTLNILLRAAGISTVTPVLSQGFSGGMYGIYLLLGIVIRRGMGKQIKKTVALCVGVGSFAAAVGMQMYLYGAMIKYNLWYDCLWLAVGAVCLFLFVEGLEITSLSPVLASLSKYSFAIYLIHNPIRILLLEPVKNWPVGKIGQTIAVFAATLFISWLLSIVLSKIKPLRKWLLYM